MIEPFCGIVVAFPCKDCPDRHQACWSGCERYQKAKAAQDEKNRQREKQRRLEEDFLSVRKKCGNRPRKWRVEEMGKHSVRGKYSLPACQYNAGVHCPNDGRKCWSCGWNPAIEEKRKAAKKNKK